MEILVEANTLPEAYHKSLLNLWKFGKVCPCPDYNTEQIESGLTMIVNNPTKEPMISKLTICGFKELQQYLLEMVDGILDFEVENGKWKYTYHDRMTKYPVSDGFDDQIQFVIDELKRNPYSRRAVIDIRNNSDDMNSADPACLQHIQYFIRDEKLNCHVLFRSNDACKATFMNAFALIMLQKKIADTLGVEIGYYLHRANSFHCYARDYEMLNGYIKRIEESTDEDNTYEYDGFWKDIMDSCTEEIMKEVSELRKR